MGGLANQDLAHKGLHETVKGQRLLVTNLFEVYYLYLKARINEYPFGNLVKTAVRK